MLLNPYRFGGAPMVATTWDPAKKDGTITLSGGNLIATKNTNNNTVSVLSTSSKSTGKWYAEMLLGGGGGAPYNVMGVATSSFPFSTYLGATADSWGYYQETGEKITNAVQTAFGASYTPGAVIGIAIDADSGSIWFAKNDVWQGSGDPAAGTSPAFTGLPGGLFLGASLYAVSFLDSATLRTSAGQQSYAPPSGFAPWD